ncbi:MAG: formate dehydrogenase accessory sulfurtransferase FdhD [Thermoplasmata archaeon]|nr:MAG: formate dehydrogenase accessory sulfurtransferase FdhD [Thermoplasmata archaeon]
MTDEEVTRDIEVLRWRDGTATREPDVVAEEVQVTLHLEPLGILDIVMTPDSIREFVYGHLYTEGLIRSTDQVMDVNAADRGAYREVLVELDQSVVEAAAGDGSFDGRHRRGTIQTECGAPSIWPFSPLQRIEGNMGMRADTVVSIPKALRERSELYVETGAFHYAWLVDIDGVPRFEAFDVGRHTAVDKAVGKALLAGHDPSSYALYTTGRISTDVARKCIRAGIPLVISRGAPLTGAVDLANTFNLGMVGFVRGTKFNLYAAEEHVEMG